MNDEEIRKSDLPEIRTRIDELNRAMLDILTERVLLVRQVARKKQEKGASIHAPVREAQVFHWLEQECVKRGLDGNYMLGLMSLIIAHAKDAECEELGLDTFMPSASVAAGTLREQLLALAQAAAPAYDTEYCNGRGGDAIHAYLRREERLLDTVTAGLPHRGLALDLGCAIGNVANVLQRRFKEVRAYDVSPHMIERAQGSRVWQSRVRFHQHDLETGIPVDDASASLAVASFGAASEICAELLPELARVLKPGGRALLSFSNREALGPMWYYPWPSTLRAHANTHNDTLEVWYGDMVYTVRNVSVTAELLAKECREQDLVLERLETYPTFLSILPRFFFSSERSQYAKLVQAVTEIDDTLAFGPHHRGTYLVAVLQKPV